MGSQTLTEKWYSRVGTRSSYRYRRSVEETGGTDNAINNLADRYLKTKDPKLVRDIIESAAGIICYHAHRYRSFGQRHNYEMEDLYQIGSEAVLIALGTYDPLKEVTFASYIYNTVPLRMMNRIKKSNRVYVPINLVGPVSTALATGEEVEPIRGIQSMEVITRATLALDPDNYVDIDDVDLIHEDPDILEILQDKVNLEMVVEAMDSIENQRTREIVRDRYGLRGRGIHTLQDLGDRYGISRERVRQLQIEGQRQIRYYLYTRGISLDL